MKITGYGSITNSTGIKKRGDATQAGSFSDLLAASDTEETTATASTNDIAATGLSLLSLQEVSDEDIKRQKLMQKGKSLLDGLEQLRSQLLIGTLPQQVLHGLSQQLALHKQHGADPRLNELIDDIELLAAVELAKMETALQNKHAGNA